MGAASTASESEIGVTGHTRAGGPVRKPKALRAGSRLAVIAPASPGHSEPEERGIAELQRLGFAVERGAGRTAQGYFAASSVERRAELLLALRDPDRVERVTAPHGAPQTMLQNIPVRSVPPHVRRQTRAAATPQCRAPQVLSDQEKPERSPPAANPRAVRSASARPRV